MLTNTGQTTLRPFLSFNRGRALSSASHVTTGQKSFSGPLHFYQNKQVELYASRTVKPLTLRQLVFFGKSMNEERLIKSANYVRTELPVRIAHRIKDMQALPYVVVAREGVAKVYELYRSAFEKFRRYPQVNTLEENVEFCHFLQSLLNEHLPVIPSLYLGLSLASHHLQPDQLDSFMRRMLVSRISRRVLAEHHLALSASFTKHRDTTRSPDHYKDENVGIIFTNLCVNSSIEHCVSLLKLFPHTVIDSDSDVPKHNGNYDQGWPEVIIDGDSDTRFSYIKEHLEYIVFELLKNALRHTMLYNRNSGKPTPAVRATIVAGPDDVLIRISDQGGGLYTNSDIQHPSDLFSFSHVRNAGRLDDVRLDALRGAVSSPRGIQGTVREQVEQQWRRVDSEGESSDLRERVQVPARIGIGLPMSNVYAGYFGGSLQLVPTDGWGMDAYVRLPRLGKNVEGIEV